MRVSTPVNFLHLKRARVPTWSGTMNTIIRTPFQQEKWNDLGQINDIHTNKKLMIILFTNDFVKYIAIINTTVGRLYFQQTLEMTHTYIYPCPWPN